MKKVEIANIQIENFKGLKELSIDFGHCTDIYGDNATGKTTVADAFNWVLFGKDSENQSAFGIKPVAADGSVARHGAVTSVAITLSIDGKECVLRKDYSEKWTKKRGSTNPVFSGHETVYSIDGIPRKKGEFERAVGGMLDETRFRILSNPAYFASVIDWNKRRETLMEMVGDVSNADVLAANADLEPLRSELEKHSPADLIKKLKADRRRVNTARNELPIRIDEAAKSIPSDADADEDAVRRTLAAARENIQMYEQRLAELQATGSATAIAAISEELARIRTAQAIVGQAAMDAYRKEVRAYESERRRLEDSIRQMERDMDTLDRSIADTAQRVDAMRAEYMHLRSEKWTGENICPTCGQALPANQVEEKRAAFNIAKSNKLEELQKSGTVLNQQIEAAHNKLTALRTTTESECEALAALVRPEAPPSPFEDTEEIRELLRRALALQNASADEQRVDVEAVQNEIQHWQGMQNACMEQLAAIEAAAATRKRIAALEDDEKRLATELERIDGMIYACEQFTRTKVGILEARINGMFGVAHWRLFREQINGGLEECCDLMVNGVPWADMNSAMRINAGIDVINTLSEHYGVSAPIIVDNAESVVALEPTDSQMIRLVVSEKDKALRIVSEDEQNSDEQTVEVA